MSMRLSPCLGTSVQSWSRKRDVLSLLGIWKGLHEKASVNRELSWLLMVTKDVIDSGGEENGQRY